HEHRFAIYGSNPLPGVSSNVFARCIGNSGMPVEIKPTRSPDPKNSLNRNLVLHDRRIKKSDGKNELGYNGYVILKLNGNALTAEYYDDNDDNMNNIPRKLLSEKWSIDINSGKLSGMEITDLTKESGKTLTKFADKISQAVGL
ncbi:MAG: hypothetical protein ABI855_19810, partial [Bacteroidota bacterium]